MSVNRLISDSRQGFRNDQKVPGFESVIIKKLNLFIIILLQQSNSIIVEVSHEEPSPPSSTLPPPERTREAWGCCHLHQYS